MMGDIDYVNTMVFKISTYEQNDIFLGDRLICTFESALPTFFELRFHKNILCNIV